MCMARIEVSVRRQRRFLPFRGKQSKPAIVVVPIPFYVLDPQQRHQGKVLQQGQRPEIAQVLAREQAEPVLEYGRVLVGKRGSARTKVVLRTGAGHLSIAPKNFEQG